MNTVKEFFLRKKVGTYLNLVVMLLAIVSLIVYLKYATSYDGLMVHWIWALLAIVIVAEGVLLFFDNDYIPIVVAGLSMVSVGLFAQTPPETLGSIADYLQNIRMFGNPDNFQIIVTIFVLMFIMGIVAIVSCFFARVKKK